MGVDWHVDLVTIYFLVYAFIGFFNIYHQLRIWHLPCLSCRYGISGCGWVLTSSGVQEIGEEATVEGVTSIGVVEGCTYKRV